ncbi:MAG: DUF4037 domain-containing protein [Lachnospiraceae bacterium]
MKGLELSRLYYQEYEEQLKKILGDDFKRVSVGLCGQGSECFGFDDDLSKDHDFGPGFCIFTDDGIYEKYGEKLERFYENLPGEFMGTKRLVSSHGQGRVGVLKTKDFYFANLGIDHVPENLFQWYQLSEERLAMVTNGALFHEGNDEFAKMRMALQGGYPKEAMIKKLASRFAVMAQAGQYNYRRCLDRGDYVAAYFALSLFMKNALSAIYLLNGKYMPFYKWAFYGMKELPVLRNLQPLFAALASSRCGVAYVDAGEQGEKAYDVCVLVEAVCGEIVKECVSRGLLEKPVDFLDDGVIMLQSAISDSLLQKLPLEM